EIGKDAREHIADNERENHSEQTADEADDHGFNQELAEYVAAPRTDSGPDPDLPGPLGHRDEHDIHHAYAPYDEGDQGDRSNHELHGGGGLFDAPADSVGIEDEEVLAAVASHEQACNDILNQIGGRIVRNTGRYALQVL